MQSTIGRGICVALGLSGLAAAAWAQGTPTVDDAKRAIDSRLQKIWKGIGTKGTRTVLFQDVRAGRPSSPGNYPFQATLLVHDQEEGYPPNHYYGRTCVGKLEQEVYSLSLDEFGAWNAQGKMTPDMSTQTCKNNPSAGVSAIPLSSLQGSPAPAGGAAPQRQTAQTPAAGNLMPPQGPYECWANGQARMLLNFSVLPNNQYRDSEGHVGSLQVAGNGRVTFRGGNLDGFMPAGFYAVYYTPQGRPTISFRNSGGSEVQFCQH